MEDKIEPESHTVVHKKSPKQQPVKIFETLPYDSFFVFASAGGTLSVAWRQN